MSFKITAIHLVFNQQSVFNVLGGIIDWGHHAGIANLALSQTAVLAKAVEKAQDLTNEGGCNGEVMRVLLLWR